jgi:hypothetical protein
MTPLRQADLERNLTEAARKVYEATPINEVWTTSQIGHELARMGRRADIRHIAGCLDSLKKDGLVKEPQPDHWQRIPGRPVLTSIGRIVEESPAQVLAPETSIDLLNEIATDLLALAEKIERARSLVIKELSDAKGDAAQLTELKTTLKRMLG